MAEVRKSRCTNCGKKLVVQFDDSVFRLEEEGNIVDVPASSWKECVGCGTVKHLSKAQFQDALKLARKRKPKATGAKLLFRFFRQMPVPRLEQLDPGRRLDAIVAAHLEQTPTIRLAGGVYMDANNKVIPSYSTDIAQLGRMMQRLTAMWPGVRMFIAEEKIGDIPADVSAYTNQHDSTFLVTLLDAELTKAGRSISFCSASFCVSMSYAAIIYSRYRFAIPTLKTGLSNPRTWNILQGRGVYGLHSYVTKHIYEELASDKLLEGVTINKDGAITWWINEHEE